MSKSIFNNVVTLDVNYKAEDVINKVINGIVTMDKEAHCLKATFETGGAMYLSTELHEVVKPGTTFTSVKVAKLRAYVRHLNEDNKEVLVPTEDYIWRIIALH